MRSVVLLIVASMYGLLNYYLSTKVIMLLNTLLPFNSSLFVRAIFLGLTSSTLATYLLANQNVSGIVGKLGTYWLGLSLLSLAIFGLSDLGRLLIKKVISENLTTSILLIDLLLIVSLFIYGVWQANQLAVTQYSISVAKKSQLEDLNVVLLSDLHLGYVNDTAKLTKIVNQINQLKPDVVVISGDLFDGNFEAVQEPEKIKDQLNKIQAANGCFVIWGNHDAGENFDKMKNFVNGSNLTLLEDELFVFPNKLAIIGRKDSFPIGNQNGQRKDVQAAIKQASNLPLIVLDHQPSNWQDYQKPVDLVLSGHTHQGQVFPFNLVTKKVFEVDYGQGANSSGTQIIVSSGAGTWGPPIRIGTKSEIVQIKLSFE